MDTRPAPAFLIIALVASLAWQARSGAAAEDLKEVQNLALPELRSVTDVVVSRDGKFAYVASFGASTVTTFKRDPATGQLEHVDTISDPALRSVVSICLSSDERLAAACAFSSNALTLFRRDPKSGRLDIMDSASENGETDRGVNFVIRACFSPNADFIYTGCATGIGVYGIKEGKLKFLQFTDGDGKLKGVRAVRLSPNGKWIYAAAMTPGIVAVFQRDEATGFATLTQTLSNNESGTKSLDGATRLVPSSDGKFVYVSSGRFRGNKAVSAFTVGEDGQLTLLQEFVSGTGDFNNYDGGNALVLSPDGKSLVALASLSDRLFRFTRDNASGKLTYVGSQQVGINMVPGAAGLCFSPDGRHLYVADESASAIVVYEMPQN